jgi:hypothetical protein
VGRERAMREREGEGGGGGEREGERKRGMFYVNKNECMFLFIITRICSCS